MREDMGLPLVDFMEGFFAVEDLKRADQVGMRRVRRRYLENTVD
jgi:hypothetical protein